MFETLFFQHVLADVSDNNFYGHQTKNMVHDFQLCTCRSKAKYPFV